MGRTEAAKCVLGSPCLQGELSRPKDLEARLRGFSNALHSLNKRSQYTQSREDKDPLSLLLPRSSNKIQLSLQARRAEAATAAKPQIRLCAQTPLHALRTNHFPKLRITKPKSSTHRMLLFAVYIILSIILLRKSCRFQSIISERKLSPSVFASAIPNISSIVFDSSA